MTEIIIKIFDVISNGNKKKIILLSVIILVTVIIGPFIFKYLYGNIRLQQQIEILNSLNSFNIDDFNDQRLLDKYNKLIEDFTKSPIETSQISVSFQLPKNIKDFLNPIILMKFFSGAFLGIIFLIASITTNQEKLIDAITGFITALLVMVIMGLTGIIFPTFNPIIINIFSVPLLQIIFFTIFSMYIIKRINSKKN